MPRVSLAYVVRLPPLRNFHSKPWGRGSAFPGEDWVSLAGSVKRPWRQPRKTTGQPLELASGGPGGGAEGASGVHEDGCLDSRSLFSGAAEELSSLLYAMLECEVSDSYKTVWRP